MKSISLLGVAAICILAQGAATKQATDRELDGFAGPVKSVLFEWSPVYSSDGRLRVASQCRQTADVFDKTGRLVQHSAYLGRCGSDEIRDEYTYAKDGSRTKKTRGIQGSAGSLPRLADGSSTAEDIGELREIFSYGASGQITEATTVRRNGKAIYKSRYSYDAQGRIIEIAEHGDDGRGPARRAYNYEGDRRVPFEFIYYGHDGQLHSKTTYTDYEFNSHGDWVKRKETEQSSNRKNISWMLRKIDYYPSS